MSTSMRYRRLQIFAAAVGVGIGVMTGQGVASAEPDDTSGSSGSSSTSSSASSESSQSSSSNSTSSTNSTSTAAGSNSTSSGSNTSPGTDTDTPPIVGGNGLHNNSSSSSTSTTAGSNSTSSGSNTSPGTDTDTDTPPIVGGNGLHNNSSSTSTTSTTSDETPASTVTGNGLSDTTETETHSAAQAPTSTQAQTEPEQATEAPPVASSVAEVVPPVETVQSHRSEPEDDAPPVVTHRDPGPSVTEVGHEAREQSPESATQATTDPVATLSATFTPESRDEASIETVSDTMHSARTTLTTTTVSEAQSFAELSIADVSDVASTLTDDFAPLLGMLVLPGLPPLGPGPTPPVPPLTWAFTAWVRRGSETARTLVETPPVDFVTTSLSTSPPFTVSINIRIPSLGEIFRQLVAGFNRIFNNRTPTATPTAPTYNADGTVTGSIGGADPDHDRLTYTVTDPPKKGNVVVNTDGTYTYTPNDPTLSGDASKDSFNVTVSDRTNFHIHGLLSWFTRADEHATTATVNIENPNQAPGPVTATVTATDPSTGKATGYFSSTDPNGDDVDYLIKTPPTRGRLDVDAESGAFTYLPDPQKRYAAGATGADVTDEFQITATDGSASTTTDLAATISPTQATTVTATGSDGTTSQVTPDGKYTVAYTSRSTGNTNTSYVTIVDNTTGEKKPSIESLGTGSVLLTESGKTAVLTTTQNTGVAEPITRVTVIDVATGGVVGTVTRDGSAEATLLSPDSSRAAVQTTVYHVATNTYDTEVTVIDTATGQALGPTKSSVGYGEINLTSDGTRVVLTTTESGNAHVTVVDTATGAVVGATVDKVGGGDVVHAMSPDDKYVIVATEKVDSIGNVTTDITVISTESGTVTDERTNAGEDVAITFAPDGKHAVVTTTLLQGAYTSTATIVDTETGVVGASVTQTGYLPRLAFTPDGSRVIVRTADYDGQQTNNYVNVIDTSTGQSIGSAFQVGENSEVAVSPDGSYAILTTDSHDNGNQTVKVTVINTATGDPTGDFERIGTAYRVVIADDGTRAVLTTRTGPSSAYSSNVTFIDTAAGSGSVPLTIGGDVVDIQLTPDGSRAAITRQLSGGPVQMTVVNTQTRLPVATVTHSGDFRGVTLSPDGSHAVLVTTTFNGATNSHTSEITVIDTTTGTTTLHATPEGNAGQAIVSPDDTRLLVTSMQYEGQGKYTSYVTVIDAATGTRVGAEIQQAGATPQFVFSPDGKRAVLTTATDGYTGTANFTVVDLDTGKTFAFARPGFPEHAVFSADGEHLVVGSRVTVSGADTSHVLLVDLTTHDVYTAPQPIDGFVADLEVVESGGDEYVVATVGKGDGTTDIALYRNPTASWTKNTAPAAATIDVDTVDPTNGAASGTILATDSDGNAVTYVVTKPPTHGTLIVDKTSGAFTYTPTKQARYEAGASGTVDTFEITATDSLGGATTTELGVVVSPVDELTITDPAQYAGAIFHSPDGRHTLLVSGGSGLAYIKVVDIATGEASETHAQPGSVSTSSISFNEAGDRVYIVTADNTNDKTYVSVIDVETGEATPTRELAGIYRASRITTDGEQTYVVVGDFLGYAPDGINTMWSSRVYIVDGDTGTATMVASVAGTVRLAPGDSEHTYIVTITNDRSKTSVTTIVNDTGLTSGTFIVQDGEGFLTGAPDGSRAVLVSSTYDGSQFIGHIAVIDAEGNRVGTEFTQVGMAGNVQFTPDGKHAYLVTLTGSWDAHAVIIETVTGDHTTVDQTGQGHLYLSSDGTKLALVTMDGNNTYTRIIDIESATALGTLTTQTGSEYAGITFTTDGKYVYVGANASLSNLTRDSSVAIVDTETGVGVTTADIPGRINKLVVTPDGEHAYITVTYDNGTAISTSVILVSKDGTQQLITTLPENTNLLQTNLLISSDGSHVVASTSNSVIVVDTATQNQTTTTFTDSVSTVVMSPDGTQVVVLTQDANSNTHVTMIDTATGTATTGVLQSGTRRQIEFSPDSDRVYVTTRSGSTFTVAVYDTDTGAQLDAATFQGNGILSAVDVVTIDGNEYLIVEFRPSTGGAQFSLLRNFGNNVNV